MLMMPGPMMTTKSAGKMHRSSGKRILTVTFCACSSAFCRRVTRIAEVCSRNTLAMGMPSRSAWTMAEMKFFTSGRTTRSPIEEKACARVLPSWISESTRANSPEIGPSNPVVVPVVYTLAVWAMVALAFIDLDVQRLPDAIQLPAYPVLALLLAACAWATADWGAFVRALLAGLILWLLYLILALVPGGGIGFGDVKLAGLLGMLLGWLSWAHVMVGTMATFLIGGVVALGVLVLAKKGRRDEFAYGPSMLLGAVCALAAPLVLRAIA